MKKTKPFGMALFAVLLFSLTNCGDPKVEPGNEKPEVLAPAQIVAIPQAKRMYENYGKRRVPIIQHYEDSINQANSGGQKPEKFDVGRFVYYDYRTIKEYLAYIEQEADAAGVEISTLRLYYSNYPDETFFPDSKDSILHPRQNSVMLSPTYKKGNRDYIFYVATGAQGSQAVPMDDGFGVIKGMGMNTVIHSPTAAHASFVPDFTNSKPNAAYAEKSLTLNRGGGIPPPYQ